MKMFSLYVQPNPVVDDGVRRVATGLGDADGLELAYLHVGENGQSCSVLLDANELDQVIADLLEIRTAMDERS